MERVHDFDEVFDSQLLFRLILRTMANPLETVNIRPFSEKFHTGDDTEKMFLALGMTLLDSEVAFCSCGNDDFDRTLCAFSLAKTASADAADYIFVKDPSRLPEILPKAKCGSLENPQKSALLIVKIQNPEMKAVNFSGPGIKNIANRKISRTVTDAVSLRDSQFYEYPIGVDFLFVDDEANLFAIPRTTRKVVL